MTVESNTIIVTNLRQGSLLTNRMSQFIAVKMLLIIIMLLIINYTVNMLYNDVISYADNENNKYQHNNTEV